MLEGVYVDAYGGFAMNLAAVKEELMKVFWHTAAGPQCVSAKADYRADGKAAVELTVKWHSVLLMGLLPCHVCVFYDLRGLRAARKYIFNTIVGRLFFSKTIKLVTQGAETKMTETKTTGPLSHSVASCSHRSTTLHALSLTTG